MPGKRVLEIEQAEVSDPAASLDQHDVLGVIIAQDGDWPKTVARDRVEHLPPRCFVSRRVDVSPNSRTIPFGEQLQLVEPLVEPVRLQIVHRRVPMKMDQYVRGELV